MSGRSVRDVIFDGLYIHGSKHHGRHQKWVLNIIVASAMATLGMELWNKHMGSTGMMIMDAWIQGVYGCNRRYPCSATIP
jgi:hypothetical protein